MPRQDDSPKAAREAAERDMQRARGLWPEIRQIVTHLVDERNENHFGRRIELALQERRHP